MLDWIADDIKSRPIPTTVHVLCDLQQLVLFETTQNKLGMIPKSYPHVRVNKIDATTTPCPDMAISLSQLDDQDNSTVQSIYPNTLAVTLIPPATIAAIDPFVSTMTKKINVQKLKAKFPVIVDGVFRPMVGPQRRRNTSLDTQIPSSIYTAQIATWRGAEISRSPRNHPNRFPVHVRRRVPLYYDWTRMPSWLVGNSPLQTIPGRSANTWVSPLVPIFNALDKLDNPRLLHMRLKMRRYSFIARW